MTRSKRIAAVLMAIGVGAGGTAVLAFQQATIQNDVPGVAGQGQAPARKDVGPPSRPPDDVDLLRAQIETRRAELSRVDAQLALAESVVAGNKRLNERIKGSVSPEEMTKAEAERQITQADRLIKGAEIRELEVMLRRALALQPSPGDPNLRRLELRFSDLEGRLGKIEQKLDLLTKTIGSQSPSPQRP